MFAGKTTAAYMAIITPPTIEADVSPVRVHLRFRTRAKLQALSNEGCGPFSICGRLRTEPHRFPGVALCTAFGDLYSAERTRFSHNCARTKAPRLSPRQETGPLRLVASSCSRGHVSVVAGGTRFFGAYCLDVPLALAAAKELSTLCLSARQEPASRARSHRT
jgi:hypothetical protein